MAHDCIFVICIMQYYTLYNMHASHSIITYIMCNMYSIIYSLAHKLFGHSHVFILTIMIYVKRIIFSNDCISKRLKDRKLKLFS